MKSFFISIFILMSYVLFSQEKTMGEIKLYYPTDQKIILIEKYLETSIFEDQFYEISILWMKLQRNKYKDILNYEEKFLKNIDYNKFKTDILYNHLGILSFEELKNMISMYKSGDIPKNYIFNR